MNLAQIIVFQGMGMSNISRYPNNIPYINIWIILKWIELEPGIFGGIVQS